MDIGDPLFYFRDSFLLFFQDNHLMSYSTYQDVTKASNVITI